MELICDCCKFSKTFKDEDAAFNAGWATPSACFGITTCEFCPPGPLLLGANIPDWHLKRHEKWERIGRPIVRAAK